MVCIEPDFPLQIHKFSDVLCPQPAVHGLCRAVMAGFIFPFILVPPPPPALASCLADMGSYAYRLYFFFSIIEMFSFWGWKLQDSAFCESPVQSLSPLWHLGHKGMKREGVSADQQQIYRMLNSCAARKFRIWPVGLVVMHSNIFVKAVCETQPTICEQRPPPPPPPR